MILKSIFIISVIVNYGIRNAESTVLQLQNLKNFELERK